MTTAVTAKIQIRKGTAAQWTSANPILLAGEIGFETDTGKIKIGDGSTTWATLVYTVDPAAVHITDHGLLSGLSDDDHTQYHTDARGDARYAPLAKGVTNGDSHDHSGGDGAQIAYSTLSGLPTLGTAATQDTSAFDAAGAAASAVSSHAGGTGVHAIASVTGLQTALDGKSAIGHTHSYEPADATILKQADVDDTPVNGVTTAPVSSNWAYDHAALATAHGISAFGSSLVDDADASTARGTLGLGTAAVAATGDFAAASHAHAASAITSGIIDTARLGSGSASASTYLRGDQTWAAAAGGVASDTHAAAEKTTPVGDDEIPLVDSAASYTLKKLKWSTIKPILDQAQLLASAAFGAR